MEEKQIDELIRLAMEKISAKKENDICPYLPDPKGDGYIHHFSMRKKKNENPKELAEMILKNILNVAQPQKVAPKRRAARGSRKPRNSLTFSEIQLKKMRSIAHMVGDMDMVRLLTPREGLKEITKRFISSIRNRKVDHELWNQYIEAVNSQAQLVGAPAIQEE